jgi:pimeloyl-ACP methyl ester carboxylesterase
MTRLSAAPDGELKSVQMDLVGEKQPAPLLWSRMMGVQLALPVPLLPIPDNRVLLIESDNDPIIPPAMREEIRRAHPQSTSVSIEGGGHFPYIISSERYDSVVGPFIND